MTLEEFKNIYKKLQKQYPKWFIFEQDTSPSNKDISLKGV
jgi:hypothetical protein